VSNGYAIVRPGSWLSTRSRACLIMVFGDGSSLMSFARGASYSWLPTVFFEISQPPSRLSELRSRISLWTSLSSRPSADIQSGYSDQAVASFVHLNSVPFFQSVSMSTAILRAVATAAFLNPRRPARRTAQDFYGEKRLTCRIRRDAASNKSPRIALSPHFDTRRE